MADEPMIEGVMWIYAILIKTYVQNYRSDKTNIINIQRKRFSNIVGYLKLR